MAHHGNVHEQHKYATRIVSEYEANCGYVETVTEYQSVVLQRFKRRSLRINTWLSKSWVETIVRTNPPLAFTRSLFLSISISICSIGFCTLLLIQHSSASEVVTTIVNVNGLPFFTHTFSAFILLYIHGDRERRARAEFHPARTRDVSNVKKLTRIHTYVWKAKSFQLPLLLTILLLHRFPLLF